ncbi:copper amine oxidase N-terminal domain-containing protein [Desulfoscipio geothermicus]|uniref:Copper amine oxidase N-terminal domain-containing protein n=1 Tax=Desulfoscipio geothermicus DSM 3669 TaxID=1121426 RepID=A0A1I6EH07_9FIRM|nr:copper amine oxidase N-terminal domain-containing protein [Desulfoscipio geothermicus]SFR16818.1 Copper amine oxidase N-terminal domain-containing protein [Desulfoscipio geothermicus DSM 3669]
MLKQKLALALVLVMMVVYVAPAFAVIPHDALNEIRIGGKWSTDLITHSVIDLVYVSEGSVTTYTYRGDNEELAINKFTVKPQSPTSASQKITPFVFELTNQYRPETDIAVTAAGPDNTVHTYTYGKYKDNAMLAIISGLPDCLGNPPVHHDSNSDSWTSKYSPEEMTKEPVTSFAVTTFALNSPTYTITSDSGTMETKTMDVKPIIKEERTFVPVRYLAYALGATESGISWDGSTQTVTLEFENATEILQLGSQTMLVNNEPVEMDVAPFAENGRTFLPARWIAEPLGAQVEWDAEKQETIIKISVNEQGQ